MSKMWQEFHKGEGLMKKENNYLTMAVCMTIISCLAIIGIFFGNDGYVNLGIGIITMSMLLLFIGNVYD